ncbi:MULTISPECIES: PEP-CTERM sorting domain-containing protein [unclassified Lentimonas]|uniref:PEP-CTERM sorting domain-containing protein n=1 Tax=unclassified Lentimonas TaxID=2630993 RepID=UPI00138A4EFE|nr:MULTISPECIES: PEP-CTERM sorting domain-containing protein [unclassified Lentimonas]
MTKSKIRSLMLLAATSTAITSQAIGQVTISQNALPATVDLTTIGTTDWMKLGDGDDTTGSFVVFEKASADFIGTVTGGPNDFVQDDFNGFPSAMSWTDGTALNTVGSSVTGSMEAKGPSTDETLPASLTFDITGLDAGDYQLNVYANGYRSNWTFGASLDGGGASDTVTQAGTGSFSATFTTDFTVAAGQTLTVLFSQNSDGLGTADNIAIGGITLAAIPEPGTYALLAGSLALCSVMVRRRRS